MELYKSLGALALGSRLKRLSDLLMQDGIRIYRGLATEFQPRWFPVFYYLGVAGPTAVTEIARSLGISHPSVNQISKELLTAGLIAAYRDASDKRRRVLALTSTGKQAMKELEPVWREIRRTLQALLDEAAPAFLQDLENLETALSDRGFQQRFDRQTAPSRSVRITDYKPIYREAFTRLNRQWISHYFELEEADRPALEDPEGTILSKGGEIVFAVDGDEVLGTCALVMHDSGIGELAKMAVSPVARGLGIGELLGQSIVRRARDRSLSLFLETNSILSPALNLYRKLGFVQKPFPYESAYGRADTYMELET